jgi:VWFA-related protein
MKGRSAIVLICWSLFGGAGAQQPFRSRVDVVSVDVSVETGNHPVAGLGPEDFEVKDNGVPQRLLDVSLGDLPLDVTFALDASSSVHGQRETQLAAGVVQAATVLGPEDTCHVLTFSERLQDLAASRACAAELGQRPLDLAARGWTSLIDAMALSLVTDGRPGRRQLVVVFTDGADTMSFFNGNTLRDLAKYSDAVVHAIAVTGTNPGGPSYPPVLRVVTEATGGQLILLDSRQRIDTWFARVVTAFRSSYVLRYSPQGVAASGWHDLSVRVTRRGKYTVRARKGYEG